MHIIIVLNRAVAHKIAAAVRLQRLTPAEQQLWIGLARAIHQRRCPCHRPFSRN